MTNGPARRAVVTGAPASSAPISANASSRTVAGDRHRLLHRYYPREDKRRTWAGSTRTPLRARSRATWSATAGRRRLHGRAAVFHLAAQAGVRDSFGRHVRRVRASTTSSPPNESSRPRSPRRRASCGRPPRRSTGTPRLPLPRGGATPTLPRSPYGVTKRACEDLAGVYREPRVSSGHGCATSRSTARANAPTWPCAGSATPRSRRGLPAVWRRLAVAGLHFVGRRVDATVRAPTPTVRGAVYNVGGGEEARLAHVIEILEPRRLHLCTAAHRRGLSARRLGGRTPRCRGPDRQFTPARTARCPAARRRGSRSRQVTEPQASRGERLSSGHPNHDPAGGGAAVGLDRLGIPAARAVASGVHRFDRRSNVGASRVPGGGGAEASQPITERHPGDRRHRWTGKPDRGRVRLPGGPSDARRPDSSHRLAPQHRRPCLARLAGGRTPETGGRSSSHARRDPQAPDHRIPRGGRSTLCRRRVPCRAAREAERQRSTARRRQSRPQRTVGPPPGLGVPRDDHSRPSPVAVVHPRTRS